MDRRSFLRLAPAAAVLPALVMRASCGTSKDALDPRIAEPSAEDMALLEEWRIWSLRNSTVGHCLIGAEEIPAALRLIQAGHIKALRTSPSPNGWSVYFDHGHRDDFSY